MRRGDKMTTQQAFAVMTFGHDSCQEAEARYKLLRDHKFIDSKQCEDLILMVCDWLLKRTCQ